MAPRASSSLRIGDGVDEVAVVGDGDRPTVGAGAEGLRVHQAGFRPKSSSERGRSRAVPTAATRFFSWKTSATSPIPRYTNGVLVPVGGDDAAALLPAVLERVEAEVGELGGLRMPMDAENTALVVGSRSAAWARKTLSLMTPPTGAATPAPRFRAGSRRTGRSSRAPQSDPRAVDPSPRSIADAPRLGHPSSRAASPQQRHSGCAVAATTRLGGLAEEQRIRTHRLVEPERPRRQPTSRHPMP